MEKTQQIADNLRRIDEWKLNSESILYSMIPRTIADRLRRGEDPISTCEVKYSLRKKYYKVR